MSRRGRPLPGRPVGEAAAAPRPRPSSRAAVRAAVARLRAAPGVTLLLDYDGTLVPFAPSPELARPDPALRELLRALASRAGWAVHLVSGRQRESLDRWLGDLPIGLHAEHGCWSRPPGAPWRCAPLPATGWLAPVRGVLTDFAARTPGALVEEKTAGLAWHYRQAAPELGAARARELVARLSVDLSGAPAELLPGAMVIEVRARGIDKGAVAAALAAASPGRPMVAIGDDRTDEDMFAALPADGLAVHVGPGPSAAGLRLRDVAEARAFLASLLQG